MGRDQALSADRPAFLPPAGAPRSALHLSFPLLSKLPLPLAGKPARGKGGDRLTVSPSGWPYGLLGLCAASCGILGERSPHCSAPGSWLLFIQVELARVKGPLKFPRLSTPRPSGPSRERPGRWRQGFGVGVGGGGTTPMHPLSFNGLLSEILSSPAQFWKGWEYPLGPK